MIFDLLVKHGTVVDGTGAARVAADVGVSGGRITAMAPGLAGGARQEIDATGRRFRTVWAEFVRTGKITHPERVEYFMAITEFGQEQG